MKWLKYIHDRWTGFFRKRRFNMLNATDLSEEWHVHLSPASILAGTVAFLLVLFIITLSLVAYTPVLEFLPGYRTEADRSRESLIQNIIRLDSMQRVMNDMMTYNENIALIMEGRTPVARVLGPTDSTRGAKVLVMPSPEDSLLRAQMEGDGPYALSGQSAGSRRRLREAIELATPVEGIITDRFDLKKGCFGVKIAAAAADRIAAVDNGTVVQSSWSPDNGCTIVIQHARHLISIYKNLSQSLVAIGQTIRSGELIGYNAEAENGEVKLFEFELWNNGKPVDPEEYIVF